MENTLSVKMIFHFYHSVVKAELKRRGFPKEVAKKIEEEHGKIVARAKDIGKSKLLSSYIMASYYIAMNRSTGKSAQENFEIFRDGLCASKLFHKVMGDVSEEYQLDLVQALCQGRGGNRQMEQYSSLNSYCFS